MTQTIKFLPIVGNDSKPIPAKSRLPHWYKDQAGYNHFNHPTIKRCMPIFDAMSAGYLLLSPANITVDSTNPAGLFVESDDDFGGMLISQHDIHQYDKYPTPVGYHRHLLRIHPLWAVQTPSGYSALFTNPIHSNTENLIALSGIIDTDNFISDGHLSFYVKDNSIIKISKGYPLVQVIPIKREEWEAGFGTVDEATFTVEKQDANGIMIDGQHQIGGYKKFFHVPKTFK